MPRNILIVEDADTAADTLEVALENIHDVRVVRALDGLRAWERLSDGEPAFDVLVTDLQIPFLSGYELIRKVRKEERLAGLPIVVISGGCDPKIRERVMELGANAFFAKPWSPAELQKTVETLIDLR